MLCLHFILLLYTHGEGKKDLPGSPMCASIRDEAECLPSAAHAIVKKRAILQLHQNGSPPIFLIMIRTEHCEQSLNFCRMIAFPPEIVNVGITEFEAKAVCSVVNAWNLQVSLKGLLAFANSFHLY